MEVLIEKYEDRDRTLEAVNQSSEQVWLKTALSNVVLLEQAFTVEFDHEEDAAKFANRIRQLGFSCLVGDGPPACHRIKAKARE